MGGDERWWEIKTNVKRTGEDMKCWYSVIGGAVVLAFATAVISCGGGSSDRVADSVGSAVEKADEAVDVPSDVLMCADSVYLSSGGAIPIGLDVTDIPESIDGLYDNVERDTQESIGEYHFMHGEEYIFTALDFGDGRIDLLMANTFSIIAPFAGESPVGLSVPFSRILGLPGVQTEWCELDDTGMWYWTWRGLWFAPDQSHLTPSLSTSLYNEEKRPSVNDFDDSVTVGYFGTGCPF